MTKQLIIGLATLSVAGAVLLGSGMYAATTTSTTTAKTSTTRMEQRDPTAMLASIKTQVSAEAYTALETLMAKHKSEMDTTKSSTTTIDQAAMQAKHEAFRTEMDALLVKYPELKTAMPQGGSKGGMMGKRSGANPMDTILSGVSAADKTAIEAIHTEYRTKQDALRTEEKAKVDTIIAKYPELKAKLDALEASRPQMGEGRGGMMGGHRGDNRSSSLSGATAQ
jgi:hypothetical protein